MSRISDLIHDALQSHIGADGIIDRHGILSSVIPKLDEDDRKTLIVEALNARIATAAKSSKAMFNADPRTRCDPELPIFEGLHSSYPLDIDGHYIKRTESLTRDEFKRVIDIRAKQVAADIVHLDRLKAALVTLTPIWERHPDWKVAQCVAEMDVLA